MILRMSGERPFCFKRVSFLIYHFSEYQCTVSATQLFSKFERLYRPVLQFRCYVIKHKPHFNSLQLFRCDFKKRKQLYVFWLLADSYLVFFFFFEISDAQ